MKTKFHVLVLGLWCLPASCLWHHGPAMQQPAAPETQAARSRPRATHHGLAVSAGRQVSPAPPIFLNIGDAMGYTRGVSAWKQQTCRRHTFSCSVPVDLDVCRDVLGCSTHLKAALLQAKEFNPDTLLVEEGGMCAEWCRANAVAYQALPEDLTERTFCKVFDASQRMLARVPERLESVFLTSMLRWPLLNEFVQGRVKGSMRPPQRFVAVDHDFMVYTSTASFFDRFGDAQAAICTSELWPYQTNGVLSLFTKDSFDDFVKFFLGLMPLFEGTCCNDMDMLKYYSGSFEPLMPRHPPRKPQFAVNNSCLPFEDGRILENVADETDEGKRQLLYHGGALYLKPAADAPAAPRGQEYERVLGAHFQGTNKAYMPWAFRPNLGHVHDASCRACLQEDCPCSGASCLGCWKRCRDLPHCGILREFEARVFGRVGR